MLHARDFLADQTVRRAEGASAPTVSVVFPVLASPPEEWLRRAIACVLAQTASALELVVADDGASPGLCAFLEDLRLRDPRVVHLHHDLPSELPALRVNEAIAAAGGARIALGAQHALWTPGLLRSLLRRQEELGPEAVVVAGPRCPVPPGGAFLDPGVLRRENVLAGAAAVVPRRLFDLLGLFDSHVALRAGWEWDFWLRCLDHVPLATVAETVGEPAPGGGSPHGGDVPLFRMLHSIDRGSLLGPARWREQQVDSLRPGGVDLASGARQRLYEDHVLPYYFRARYRLPRLEGFSSQLSAPRTILTTKRSYDVSNDVTLTHYDAISNRRGHYKTSFQPLSQVDPEWTRDADAVLLVRTVEDQAGAVLDRGLTEGKPVGVYLDDDLLHFHEYGPEFGYLAPGTPYHRNLSGFLARCDAVWVTNGFLEDSVRSLNPRCLPHNNAVPEAALPARARKRDPRAPVVIGYAGSGYRLEEFREIWPDLRRFCAEWRDRVRFEFWGLDVSSLPALSSPYTQQAFTFSYPRYLRRLAEAGFDVLLTPLLDHPRPRLAKSLIKYYECAVAGALGIFSDVPQYAALPAGLTCLKAANAGGSWFEALQTAMQLPLEEFDAMRGRAIEHVRDEYTERAQIDRHEAAWRATELHCATRHLRPADGRPRILIVAAPGDLEDGAPLIWRHAATVRGYGLEPVVVLPADEEGSEAAAAARREGQARQVAVEVTPYRCLSGAASPENGPEGDERAGFVEILSRFEPALVHCRAWVPAAVGACRERGVPHVLSLGGDGVEEAAVRSGQPPTVVTADSLAAVRRWRGLGGGGAMCIRPWAAEAAFAAGERRFLRRFPAAAGDESAPVRVAVALLTADLEEEERVVKSLGTIAAAPRPWRAAVLCRPAGSDRHRGKRKRSLRSVAAEGRVVFCEQDGVVPSLEDADVLWCAGTGPSWLAADALAHGVLVVTSSSNPLAELLVDGVSAILEGDPSPGAMVAGIQRALGLSSEQRWEIAQRGRRMARGELHPWRAAHDLMLAYTRATSAGIGASVSSHARETPTRGADPASGRRWEPGAPEAGLEAASMARAQVPGAAAWDGHVEEPLQAPARWAAPWPGASYRVVPARAAWSGLGVVVRGAAGPGTSIDFVLRSASEVIRSGSVVLPAGGGWIDFRFPPISNAAGRVFSVELKSPAGEPGEVTVAHDTLPSTRGRHFPTRAPAPLPGLYCRLWYVLPADEASGTAVQGG